MNKENKISESDGAGSEKENDGFGFTNSRENKMLYEDRCYVDIIALVRSLQRGSGQVDCFRSGNADCDSIECDWRLYCLGNKSGLGSDIE